MLSPTQKSQEAPQIVIGQDTNLLKWLLITTHILTLTKKLANFLHNFEQEFHQKLNRNQVHKNVLLRLLTGLWIKYVFL